MSPSCFPAVVEEVFDSPFPCNGTTIPQVHLLQELIAPEDVSLETVSPNAIPSALVSALDPECCLNCHALRGQIKWHNIQYGLQTSSGSGTMHMGRSQQT